MRETSDVIGVLIQQKPLVSMRTQAVKLHRNNISTFSISSSQIVYGWTRKTFEGGIFLALYKTKYVKLFTPRLNQLVSKDLVSKRLVTVTTFHSRKQFAWLFVWINQVETGLIYYEWFARRLLLLFILVLCIVVLFYMNKARLKINVQLLNRETNWKNCALFSESQIS